MSYLYAITLVVIAGAVTAFSAGLGALLNIVFDPVELSVLFFLVGVVVGLAILVAHVAALIRADIDRNRARNMQR